MENFYIALLLGIAPFMCNALILGLAVLSSGDWLQLN